MADLQELKNLSLATTYEVDDSFDSDKYIKLRLRVCHDGINPNQSNFEVSDMETASESIKNIPILANVVFDEEGQPQFGGHDMDIVKDYNDEYRLIYQETPIGLIPETCNHTIEEWNGKNYVFVDGYIWKGYANYAQDIIERDNDIKLSMEILVNTYSYNAKEKYYNITDYKYQGITLLNKDFGTGMENALATTGTFSEQSKDKFIFMMEELKETLNNYNQNKKEGGSIVDEKIIALLEQYNLTPATISFSLDNLTYEEVENKLKESCDLPQEDTEAKFIKTFELSHEDIRCALYNLLSVVEEEDNDWYWIDSVHDEYFEYRGWSNKIYRQGYVKDGDNISFDGDRIELFEEKLTAEEKQALDDMRNNYSLLQNEFAEYKEKYTITNEEAVRLQEFEFKVLKEQRENDETAIFEQFEEQLNGVEEFEMLKENKSNYELDELEKECFVILGKKNSTASFSNKNKKNEKVKIPFSKNQEEHWEFEEIFEKYGNK